MKKRIRQKFSLINIPIEVKEKLDKLMCSLNIKTSYGKLILYLIENNRK